MQLNRLPKAQTFLDPEDFPVLEHLHLQLYLGFLQSADFKYIFFL